MEPCLPIVAAAIAGLATVLVNLLSIVVETEIPMRAGGQTKLYSPLDPFANVVSGIPWNLDVLSRLVALFAKNIVLGLTARDMWPVHSIAQHDVRLVSGSATIELHESELK